MLLPWLLACSTLTAPHFDVPSAQRRPAPVGATALARTPILSADLPQRSRPDGVPEVITPFAPFAKVSTDQESEVWATPLPVDFSVFLQRNVGARTFGNWSPDGLSVEVGERSARFLRGAVEPGTWGFTPRALLVGRPRGAGPPEDVHLTWPRAVEAERTLHAESAGRTPDAFVRRTVRIGTDAHLGVLAPAPAAVTWSVTVPERGVLSTRATMLRPVIRSATGSDGATVVVRVNGEDVQRAVVRSDWIDVSVDLAAYAGQTVELTLATEPGDRPDHDLVFLEDPTVYTPSDHPRTVIVAFVDTVRADHLGMYGYPRPTSPTLDAWAATGLRFEQARSVAPWTLPSTLSALSGQVPEEAPRHPTLADLAGAAGFHTEAIVANAYLSPVFGTHRGFASYAYRILQPARDTVDQALTVLARHDDRDRLLLVQFMEAHLPYREPRAYEGLFAGPAPRGHVDPMRHKLDAVAADDPELGAIRQYVVDRYDQNLRVLDDEVGRLFSAAGDEAITVLFADHGEEFWDHGGFEHGHAFWDELLRVPWVVRGPGVTPGVSEEAVSLLDLTPTLLDLVGVDDLPPMRGRSVFSEDHRPRPLAFGHALYGPEGWGVVEGGHKWSDRDGVQSLYDVAADPAETQDLAATARLDAYPEALASALGRPVVRVWRMQLGGRLLDADKLTVTHPQGIEAAWLGYDPRGMHAGVTAEVADGVLTVGRPPMQRLNPVVFVQPVGDAREPAGLTVSAGVRKATAGALAEAPQEGPTVVMDVRVPLPVRVDLVWAPVPGAEAVDAYDPEVEEALRELGYVE